MDKYTQMVKSDLYFVCFGLLLGAQYPDSVWPTIMVWVFGIGAGLGLLLAVVDGGSNVGSK